MKRRCVTEKRSAEGKRQESGRPSAREDADEKRATGNECRGNQRAKSREGNPHVAEEKEMKRKARATSC